MKSCFCDNAAMGVLRFCAALAATLACAVAAAAHPGIDPLFGAGGIADMPAGTLGLNAQSRFDFATLTRAEGDGGTWYVFASNYQSYALGRFGANGVLDTAFGGGGAIWGSVPAASARPMAVGLAESGRPLIAAGDADYFRTALHLRRVTRTGAPDTGFGLSGFTIVTFPEVVTDNGTVPVGPTGIVARTGGGAFVTMARSAVVAITEQGAVESSFAAGGFLYLPTTTHDHYVYQDTVLAVTAGGQVYALRKTATASVVVRFGANGALDPTYNAALPAALPWSLVDSHLDRAGNLYLAFKTAGSHGYWSALAICKVDAQGRLDPTFGTGGVAVVDDGDASLSQSDPAYRLTDVADDGTLLVAANVTSQFYTAPLGIRVLDASGNPLRTFGGKGVTRIEQAPVDSRYFYGASARFDAAGRVVALGIGSAAGETLRALRLNRTFLHRATVADARTNERTSGTTVPQTTFQYGAQILADARVDGDAGAPAGMLRFDAGPWSCSENVVFTFPAGRVGCAVLADRIGQVPWTLAYLGDQIYGPAQASGPDIRVGKRTLSAFATYFDKSARVDDWANVGVRWSSPLPSPGPPALPAGTARLSLGAATCEVPLDIYTGASCRVIAREVGTAAWTVEYLGDPYFTSDPLTVGPVTVQPAERAFSLNFVNGTATVSVAGADAHCGVRSFGTFDLSTRLPSLPRPNPVSSVKGGAITLTTVPGCPPHGALAISVTYPFDVAAGAELWSYLALPGSPQGGWLRLPATISGRTVTASVVEGSIFDTSTEAPGTLATSFVLYNANGSPEAPRFVGLASYAFGAQAVAVSSAPATIVLTNVGTSPLTVASLTSTNPAEFRLSDVTCAGNIPPGGICLFGVSFTPAMAGARTGTIAVASNAAGGPFVVNLSGTGVAAAPLPRLVEYRHAGFDHYFLTSIADEIGKLDTGVIAGWTRTGLEIASYPLAARGETVCRFFSASFAPRSSHFYTASASECATVKGNPVWQFEGTVFNVDVPAADGTCPASTLPVYRLYNNGKGGAPNHRYTTSLAVRDDMLAQGWIPEGYGPLAVMMCAPVEPSM